MKENIKNVISIEETLHVIENRFSNETATIPQELGAENKLPLLNFAENANFGISKALNWAYKLGIKDGRKKDIPTENATSKTQIIALIEQIEDEKALRMIGGFVKGAISTLEE